MKFKHRIKLFYLFWAIAFLAFFPACSQDPWTDEEKDEVMKDCMKETEDKSYCDCYLEKLINRYPLAEEAERISFEEAVEIGTSCK